MRAGFASLLTGVSAPLFVAAAALYCVTAEAQSRISAQPRCGTDTVQPIHFDQTLHQADYKVMVSEYEVEPDLRIRLVSHPDQADLILADELAGSDYALCRSSTRYRATTLFVAKFVPQPDITIMLNRRDRHADYTLYVDSRIVSDDEAAALFGVLWEQRRQAR